MTVAPLKEKKDYTFQDDIMMNCIKVMEENAIPDVDVRALESIYLNDIFDIVVSQRRRSRERII